MRIATAFRRPRPHAASHAVMSGENLPRVSKLPGHRRYETTNRHVRLDDAMLGGAAERAAGRIAKAMGFEGRNIAGGVRQHADAA